MSGASLPPLLGDNPSFVASWKTAIARQPEIEQQRRTEFMEICFAHERNLREAAMDIRDCNVIMARTVGRLEVMNHDAR